MATITESIDSLIALIARCAPEEKRRYQVELIAYLEMAAGDPYNEQPFCHANDRYAYREARERAYWQLKIEGR